jgi:hypothetical protein
MSEFERPSYVSNSGEQDPKIVESLIAASESKIQALERKIQSVPSAAVASVEAQIKAEMKRLDDLRSDLDKSKSSN